MAADPNVIALVPRDGRWRLVTRSAEIDPTRIGTMTKEAAESAGLLWFERPHRPRRTLN
ncbi:hypothetical protein [Zavarzinia sp. CC-PAN008]|uniref:hypothetical protein n=1 Tax=Zavarzinia sp. CC-PAN008 TaxID=3243332 RepID=UPI003F744D27